MTEQLIYKIYKITNSIDDKIYIGSTRQTLRKRMEGHRSEVRKNNPKTLSQHMKGNGIENFNIELIKEIQVPTAKLAKIQEQVELWNIPIEQRLNDIRAHIPNHNYCNDRKRKNRRDFYHRKKQDPEWAEKERIRNRDRMRIKRQLARNRLTD